MLELRFSRIRLLKKAILGIVHSFGCVIFSNEGTFSSAGMFLAEGILFTTPLTKSMVAARVERMTEGSRVEALGHQAATGAQKSSKLEVLRLGRRKGCVWRESRLSVCLWGH